MMTFSEFVEIEYFCLLIDWTRIFIHVLAPNAVCLWFLFMKNAIKLALLYVLGFSLWLSSWGTQSEILKFRFIVVRNTNEQVRIKNISNHFRLLCVFVWRLTMPNKTSVCMCMYDGWWCGLRWQFTVLLLILIANLLRTAHHSFGMRSFLVP